MLPPRQTEHGHGLTFTQRKKALSSEARYTWNPSLVAVPLCELGQINSLLWRTDAEAETPILWPPDVKSWLVGKDPDAGKDWRWGKKRDDGGWDGWRASLTQWTWVWINSGVGDGQGGLVCCSPWSHKEWNTTEALTWSEWGRVWVAICPINNWLCFQLIKFNLSFPIWSRLWPRLPLQANRWPDTSETLFFSLIYCESIGKNSNTHVFYLLCKGKRRQPSPL